MKSAQAVTAATAAAALAIGPQVSSIQRRAASALLGSIVGDAAAQTSHWNYDRSKFHAALLDAGRYDEPEFFASNNFYSLPPGSQSCYGDQMLEVARHVDEWNVRGGSGPTSEDGLVALVDRFELAFGPSSEYGPWPLPEGHKPAMPIVGPWRHGSIKGFLTNLKSGKREYPGCGSDDSQADALARTVPVVCAYAGDADLLGRVEKVVRVTQNSHTAVAYARILARILEAFILGVKTVGAIDIINTRDVIRAALQVEGDEIVALQELEEEEAKARVEACKMVSLVLEVLDGNPPSFEEAVSVLGDHPLMKPRLGSPVAVVA